VILEVKDIQTYYGTSYILQGVSLEIAEGSFVSMLGRNGAGKTTLIRSIIGFTPPRRGKIIFSGIDITHLTPNQIARLGVGLVPQGRRIFPSLTVRENLLIAARKKDSVGWTMEKIFDIFPILKSRAQHIGDKLSGGEQQMLSIARALMGNPDLLLMDEPTEGLAPVIMETLYGAIKILRAESVSIFLVEQNLVFAMKLASYIYIMNNGEIVHHSTVEEFKRNEHIKDIYLGI